MKITEKQLNQIIQEEIDQTIEEGWLDRLKALGGTYSVEDLPGDSGATPNSRRIMRDHHKKIEYELTQLIGWESRLDDRLRDPGMEEALSAAKSVVTRIGRILEPTKDEK